MNTHNIEGKLLRQFIIGALYQYMTDCQLPVEGEQFQYMVTDTCNKVHKYLTDGFSTSAAFSDTQCNIASNARVLLGIKPGDSVTIYW